MRIQKAVSHPDSCFFNKKQRKQLTSMCLQLPLPNEQQQEAEEMSTVPAAVAAAQEVQVKELKTILKTAGLDVEGLKISLLQRVHKANLMHHLENPRAAETLLKNYEVLHGKVGAEDASADEEEAAAEAAAEQLQSQMQSQLQSKEQRRQLQMERMHLQNQLQRRQLQSQLQRQLQSQVQKLHWHTSAISTALAQRATQEGHGMLMPGRPWSRATAQSSTWCLQRGT